MPTATNGDVRIGYETFGDTGGEPLLLIMGLTFQMVWWPDEFCQLLADRGFHVARFDNRDAGLSTRFSGRRRAYTAHDMAGDAIAVMDALGWQSAHLFGGSLGATIAQVIAVEHPARVRTLVCAMCGGVGGSLNTLRFIRLGALARLATKRYPHTREGDVQSLVDTFRAMSSPRHVFEEEWARRTAELSWERGLDPTATRRQTAAGRTAGNLRARLAELDVPTLVLHGEDDPLIRLRAGRDLAGAVPGARFITYPAMGHELPRAHWESIADEVHRLAKAARR
jgi:pimeloyl-ACP methyl ester carboxylesterase